METQILEYYDWDGVENFLCEAMNFDPQYFRDYHKVAGGGYKDFWHVWLSINYDSINNDNYNTLYLDEYSLNLVAEDIQEKYGEWALILVDALKKLREETGKDEITIYYSW